jgi:hypothetical protein
MTHVASMLVGIVLLVAGIVLSLIGVNASVDSFAYQWSNFFAGHLACATVLCTFGGIASAGVGASLVMLGGRSAA